MKQFDFLKKEFDAGKMGHAYLTKKNDGIREFLQYIHCNEKNKPCFKNCSNCMAMRAGSFPDVMTIMSSGENKDSNEISIAQVREAQRFLSFKPFYNLMKTVIVMGAEKMTLEAQNCFLKTLEEPKGNAIIFLVSEKPAMLLPTILSRCHELKSLYSDQADFSREESDNWSKIKDIINYNLSEKFNYVKNLNLTSEDLNNILNFMQKYFRKIMLAKIGIGDTSEAKDYPIEKIKDILINIDKIYYQNSTSNINFKLALEVLLMEV